MQFVRREMAGHGTGATLSLWERVARVETKLLPYLRAAFLALVILVFLLAAPLQWLLAQLFPRARHTLPMLFHRAVCAATGLRVRVSGAPAPARPQFVIANHVSWLDIPALGGHAPLCFLAKTEVGEWPVVGLFARLQGCVFVDRGRRRAIPQVNRQMTQSLLAGRALVLFPEATTGDGNRLLKFYSPHFQAAIDACAPAAGAKTIWMQPLAIRYTRRQGLPYNRLTRPDIAWYGDMALLPHLWDILRGGPVDCELRYGAPVAVTAESRRKPLAAAAAADIHACLTAIHYRRAAR